MPGLAFLHAPSGQITYPHRVTKLLVFLASDSFCEGVRDLFSSGDISEINLTLLELMAHKMIPDFDMFCPIVELRVPGYSNGGLVVDMKECGRRWWLFEFR